MKEDIEKAMKWAYENLLNSKYYCPAIKNYVSFDSNGIKHAIKSKTYITKIKLIYQCVDLLKKAKLISVEPDKKNRKEIKRVFTLKTNAIVDGSNKTVFITLREKTNGVIYYDHNALK